MRRLFVALVVSAMSVTAGVASADGTGPTITCPATFQVEANTTGGANVASFPAAQASGTGVTVTAPTPGFYPLGLTSVTYTATDSSGNQASCNTDLAVIDTTPPTVTCPANIVTTAGPGGTATVPFVATASDIAAPSPTINITTGGGTPISSPGTFPVGTTTVFVRATDANGNSGSCVFTVTVLPPVPTSKAQCENGGWKNVADDQGQPFKNQGDCIRYVNQHSGG